MAVKTVFYGEDRIELECFLDDTGLIVGVYQSDDGQIMGNMVTLNKEDTKELIKVLTELESKMK